MTQLIEILAGVIAVLFVLVPHEFAHALVAYKCGDATAKYSGRLTLNPIKHLDITGFVLCIFTGFGWAKPVPVNSNNFKHYRSGLFLTSVAGVIANFIVAFFAYLLFIVVYKYAGTPTEQVAKFAVEFVKTVFSSIFIFSLGVFAFNLLPLHPLDGFRIVEAFTREVNPVRRFLKNYGMWILIILVLESFLCYVLQKYAGISIAKYFDILGYVKWFAVNIIGFPITALWNTVFGFPLNFHEILVYAY